MTDQQPLCVLQLHNGITTWCGRDRSIGEWAFADALHAIEATRNNNLKICPDCARAIIEILGKDFEQEIKILNDKIYRMNQHALHRDRRIRAQRRQLHETWEIVEARRKWLGDETTRRYVCRLLDRNKQLLRENEALRKSLSECETYCETRDHYD